MVSQRVNVPSVVRVNFETLLDERSPIVAQIIGNCGFRTHSDFVKDLKWFVVVPGTLQQQVDHENLYKIDVKR